MLVRQFNGPILLVAASVCLVLGLTLPIVKVNSFLVISSQYSIADGILLMIDGGDLFVASILVLFSILLPMAKLAALALIWRRTLSGLRVPFWLPKVLECTAKWAMLDVLVVALIVFSFKARDLFDASAGYAILFSLRR